MDSKKGLQKIIEDLKLKKFRETEAKGLISEIGKEQMKSLGPVLEEISRQGTERMVSAFEKAIRSISIEVPEIPDIRVPAIELPPWPDFPEIPRPIVDVSVPPIQIPEIKMPDEMEVKGWINLMGYDRGLLLNPLPVQLRDAKGNPINLLENLTKIMQSRGMGGGEIAPTMKSWGGGKADFLTIKGFMQSAFAEIMNPDGQVKVSLPSGSSGLTDAELRAAHLDVQQVSGSTDSVNVLSSITLDTKQLSGSIDSVYVTGIANSSFSELQNGDGRLRVSVETGGSGLTDSELRAAHLDVQQLSGSVDSVYVNNPAGDGDAATALRILQAGESVSSVYVRNPVDNGDAATALRVVIAGNSISSVSVIGTMGANIVDSTGVAYSGSNPIPVNVISQSLASSASALVDSTGVQYSGSNPVPITLVSGGLTSTIAVGPTVADTADDGSAPVQGGGIARTANPTPVAANDVVKSTHDDLGRQLIRPLQVRDLISTAYATFANGTEATLLAGVAGAYLDLIYILAANNSTAAIGIDIRPSTAGSIVMHLEIPANGVVGVSLPVPIPQQATGDGTGGSWTVDLPDVTGTTVSVSALFSREV